MRAATTTTAAPRTLDELRDDWQRAIRVRCPRSCSCGSERDPERVLDGVLSWLQCARCRGRTTARKDAKGRT
jgi:hypothetical protein